MNKENCALKLVDETILYDKYYWLLLTADSDFERIVALWKRLSDFSK